MATFLGSDSGRCAGPAPTVTLGPGRLWRAFAPGLSYGLGSFNDNFFKQATLLLAVSAGADGFQAQATLCFALPFVLLSAPAGWLADRYAKKDVMIWAKLLEVAAMMLGAWGILTLNWPCLLGMIFCMGLNSTLFIPALNGSIPELFAEKDVPRINALFKLTSTLAILLGIVLAGIALDQHWWSLPWNFGRALVGFGALAAALLGLVTALAVVRTPAAGSRVPFPRRAMFDTFGLWWSLRSKDPALFTVTWAVSFFYALSVLLLLEINRLGVGLMHLSFSLGGLLPLGLMAGICVGALLAGRGTATSWRTLAVPCLWGMAVSIAAVWVLLVLPAGIFGGAAKWATLFGLYFSSGVCGGLFLIPLSSFLQVRPAASDKGKIMGMANCLDFTGILLAGQAYMLLEKLNPMQGHLALGGLCVLAAVGLRRALRSCN